MQSLGLLEFLQRGPGLRAEGLVCWLACSVWLLCCFISGLCEAPCEDDCPPAMALAEKIAAVAMNSGFSFMQWLLSGWNVEEKTPPLFSLRGLPALPQAPYLVVAGRVMAAREAEWHWAPSTRFMVGLAGASLALRAVARRSLASPLWLLGVASPFGADPAAEMNDDLMRLEAYFETGKPARDAAQPLPAARTEGC